MLENKPSLTFLILLFILMRCTPDVKADTRVLMRCTEETIYYCDHYYDVSDVIGLKWEKWYEKKVYTTFNPHFSEMFSRGYLVILNDNGWTVEQYNGSILKVYKGE